MYIKNQNFQYVIRNVKIFNYLLERDLFYFTIYLFILLLRKAVT